MKQIKDKAINYGEARYGRSCRNCVYYKLHKARGSMCVLHDLPTSTGKCCGTWCGYIDVVAMMTDST
jgi:hypothetical protein